MSPRTYDEHSLRDYGHAAERAYRKASRDERRERRATDARALRASLRASADRERVSR